MKMVVISNAAEMMTIHPLELEPPPPAATEATERVRYADA